MAAFLSEQLDFIFFFYGLAFILLGAPCWAIARSKAGSSSWVMLGGFAFLHGVGEWLDLTALIVGDGPVFAVARTTLMTLSFAFLLDFARLEAIRLGLNLPGRWIYVPALLLVALVGVFYGTTAANIAARYLFGFVAAAATGLVFAWAARTLRGAARNAGYSAAAGFFIYAVAAGIVVPAAAFWPASAINYPWFVGLTAVPIQLVRGVLAVWISFSIWGLWIQQLSAQLASKRYAAFARQQFIWTLTAMGTILISGWILTEFLGGIYRQNVQDEARRDIDLLASRLAGYTATIEGMVKAFAGSPSLAPVLVDGNHADKDTAASILDLHIDAANGKSGFLLDPSGKVILSSRPRPDFLGANDPRLTGYFREALGGAAGYQFVFDPVTGARDYYASQPVRTDTDAIIGVAVLTKSLDAFEADLRQFDRPYFLIDPTGLVVMSNRPESLGRHLWPVGDARPLPGQTNKLLDTPMLKREVVDGTWTIVDNERNYVRRRFANHSDWSLVILKPTREIFATRFLGIVITLLATIMALIYLLGRARWVHDDVLADNRIRLQELTMDLDLKASTDALTGLHNRLKLDQSLEVEMARAQRYGTPLSLMLYDIDHFKRVNDTHGHLVGDKVLVQLSRFVPNLIRKSDLLARWGGEEFIILAPGSGGPRTFQAAEKLRDAVGHVVFDEVGPVTCSFGVAEWIPGESAAEFIARADAALYRAKANGRNQVVLAPPSGSVDIGPPSRSSL